MKFLTFTFLLLSIQSFACDQAEAQILAKVVVGDTDSMHYCRAIVTAESIEIYNESEVCPLSKEEVISKGVEFPLTNGHDCDVYRGDTITGVVYKKGEIIYLD